MAKTDWIDLHQIKIISMKLNYANTSSRSHIFLIYKIAIVMYKVVNNIAPTKVSELFSFSNVSFDLRSGSQSAFTCNRDETSFRVETRPGMKKVLFTREFHPRMKFVSITKFNLKENLPLSMKKQKKLSF